METFFKSSFLGFIACWFLLLLPPALAQIGKCSVRGECNAPFLEIPSNSPVVSSNAIKNYRISLDVTFINSNDTEINATIFTTAANSFYISDPILEGFISPITIQSSSSNQIEYLVKYNYTMLNSSVNGTDEIVKRTLENTTYVDQGLKMNADFQAKYNVSNTNLVGGNCLCLNDSDSICVGYPDYTCTSQLDGVSISCARAAPYCYNEGYCFKNEADGKKVCSCQNTFNYWHVGEKCQTMFHIWMVIVFFVVVGLVLLVIIPLITYYCIRTIDKRILKEKEQEEKKKLKASAKELDKKNRDKAKIDQNGQKSEVNGDTYSSRNLSSVVAPVPVPRHNIPPASYTSADSFDQSSLAASNPTSTRTQPRNPEIEQENIDRMYASVKRTNVSQISEARSETSSSSSSSDDTESEGYNAGRTSQPPIPYQRPPSYLNFPPPEVPMVTTV